MGGIKGFEAGNLSGYDIKATDNTLFAILGSKNISQNISDAIFHKLADTARIFLKARLYYVLIDEESGTHEKWIIGNEEYQVSQKRVFIISLNEFYSEITKQGDSFELLCKALPVALNDYALIQQPS